MVPPQCVDRRGTTRFKRGLPYAARSRRLHAPARGRPTQPLCFGRVVLSTNFWRCCQAESRKAVRDSRRRAPHTFAVAYDIALELPRIAAPPRPRHTFKISHVLKGLRKKTLPGTLRRRAPAVPAPPSRRLALASPVRVRRRRAPVCPRVPRRALRSSFDRSFQALAPLCRSAMA
jgi:hypothetical protein